MAENISEFKKLHRCPECNSVNTTASQSHGKFFISCNDCKKKSPLEGMKKAA